MPTPTPVRILRGPNQWGRVPVVEITLACGAPEGEALAHLLLQLQIQCGAKVAQTGVASGSASGECVVTAEYEDEAVIRECLAVALNAFPACEVPSSEIERLQTFAGEIVLGPNTRALAGAARRRGIPVRRLDSSSSLLQLGHGVRQRRLCGARSDRTSAIAESIGWEKPLAKELLRAVGIPVPEGRLVTTAADALRVACEIGAPVVVKPESANHGRAVFIGLTHEADIAAAFERARIEGETTSVLVERCISGSEHRLLMVEGRMVAAMRGDPLYAVGDGRRTLAELVEEINRDPRRGDDPDAPLYPVRFDELTVATLERQGCTPASVPAAGDRVLLQRNGNLCLDVTGSVHPSNQAICALAAETIGLDIAGIDLVVDDISLPMREQGGAILEVNPMPGFAMHLSPFGSAPRHVDDAILAALYAPGADGRIPIAVVHGGPEATAIALRLYELLVAAGLCAGLACAAGTFAGAERTRAGRSATTQAAADLLLHPRIEAAVFEVPERAVIEEGLAFDRADVLIVAGAACRAACVLLETVPAGGTVFVPDNAEWLCAAQRHCAGAVVPYRGAVPVDQAAEATLARYASFQNSSASERRT